MKRKKKSVKEYTYSFNNSDNNFLFFEKLSKIKYLEYFIPAAYLVVLLTVSITYHKIGNYGVESDFFWSYFNSAKEFLKGNIEIDSYRGPIYPMVLGIAGFILNSDFFNAGMYLNIICAFIVLLLINKTISLISNKTAGLLVVLLLSTNSQFIKYSYCVGTDMLFIVFFVSSLYFILKDESNLKNSIFAGIFTGLAYLTRYTAISLIILFCFILIAKLYNNYKNKTKIFNGKTVYLALSYFVPVFFFLVLWGLFCLSKKGVFFYNDNFLNSALMIYKPNNMPNNFWIELYQGGFKSFYDVMFRDFELFLQKIFLENLFSYFIKDMSTLVPDYFGAVISAGLIICLLFVKKLTQKEKLWLALSFIFYFQVLLTFYSERFTLPILPFYFYLSIKLFTFKPVQKFNNKFLYGKLAVIAFLIIIPLNFYYSYQYVSDDISSGPAEILEIKDWLDKYYKEPVEGKILASYKPHISYYLKTKHEQVLLNITQTKNDTKTNMKNNLSIIKPDYLYLSTRELTMPDVAPEKLNEFYLKTLPSFIPELKVITYTTAPLACLYKYNKKE